MTPAERQHWRRAQVHVEAAFRILAHLDEETSGEQQFAACLLRGEAGHLRKALTQLLGQPSPERTPLSCCYPTPEAKPYEGFDNAAAAKTPVPTKYPYACTGTDCPAITTAFWNEPSTPPECGVCGAATEPYLPQWPNNTPDAAS